MRRRRRSPRRLKRTRANKRPPPSPLVGLFLRFVPSPLAISARLFLPTGPLSSPCLHSHPHTPVRDTQPPPPPLSLSLLHFLSVFSVRSAVPFFSSCHRADLSLLVTLPLKKKRQISLSTVPCEEFASVCCPVGRKDDLCSHVAKGYCISREHGVSTSWRRLALPSAGLRSGGRAVPEWEVRSTNVRKRDALLSSYARRRRLTSYPRMPQPAMYPATIGAVTDLCRNSSRA